MEADEESEFYYLEYHADFLNRLTNFKFVPASTVQVIADEFLSNSKKSQELREKRMRHSLSGCASLSSNDIDKIIDDTICNDQFIQAQEALSSHFKRTKFIKDHFKYVYPVEILLNKEEVGMGKKKDILHYIPLEETLRNILTDESFQQMMKNEESHHSFDANVKLKDINDGSLRKTNEFFIANPGALGLLFYSDGVELKNPLGSARGTYKVVQVFFTLIDIPKYQRCQIDRLQLVMVFREALLKKYSYSVIYKRLVDDLLKLEEGVLIDHRRVKFGLLLYAADNLEAHQLGGFSKCFSSNSICRFCHCQYENLDSHIHDFDGETAHKRWSISEYDSIVASLGEEGMSDIEYLYNNDGNETDDNDSDGDEDGGISDSDNEDREDWGVKSKCPLNKLSSFHSVGSMPPDLMHDLLEGIVPEDLLSIIKALSARGWFTIDAYNERLRKLGWQSYESRDRPESVVSGGKSASKLKGKAISQWVHLRNFPVLIEPFVQDKDDPVLALALKLHEVTERVTAGEFYEYEIELLHDSVIEYLEMRKNLRSLHPNIFKRPKPKHHFLR